MDKPEILAIIEEAIIKERWRIANRIETFTINMNAIDSDSYSSTYAIEGWQESCYDLADKIRGIQVSYANFWRNFMTDDGKASFTCKKCEYATRKPRGNCFECNIFTKENLVEENGMLKVICPKCGTK